MTGKEGVASFALEAISVDLWMWLFSVCTQVAMASMFSVRSNVFDELLNGKRPPLSKSVNVPIQRKNK